MKPPSNCNTNLVVILLKDHNNALDVLVNFKEKKKIQVTIFGIPRKNKSCGILLPNRARLPIGPLGCLSFLGDHKMAHNISSGRHLREAAYLVPMWIGTENRSTRRKPAPVSRFPPQTPRHLTCDWTRAAAFRSRRLTEWCLACPLIRLAISPLWTQIEQFSYNVALTNCELKLPGLQCFFNFLSPAVPTLRPYAVLKNTCHLFLDVFIMLS